MSHKSDKKRHKSDKKHYSSSSSSNRYDDEEDIERRQRKEMKKAAKVAKELGYSNEINPFGDSNLLQPFVWGKKKERDAIEGKKDDVSGDAKRVEVMSEIQKVRKRRQEREDELAEIERLRDEEQRLREAVQYGDWQKKEEDFHLEQTKERSKIRLIENREKPIDLIARNVLLIESAESTSRASDADREKKQRDVHLLGVNFEPRSPVDLIDSFNTKELDSVRRELGAYLELEVRKKGSYEKYWRVLILLVESAKTVLDQKMNNTKQASIHESVVQEVAELLSGKSIEELDDLESDVRKNMQIGKGGDVEYWETLLKEIQIQRAREYAKQVHVTLMKRQIELLSDVQLEQRRLREEASAAAAAAAAEEPDADLLLQRRYASGGLLGAATIGGGADFEHSSSSRSQLTTSIGGGGSSSSSSSSSSTGDSGAVNEGGKQQGDEEGAMAPTDEVMLPGATYWWDSKYRPRKPRYFNKIRTGWDWNKYNSTHYDRDNPPPKVVQGYRFTIFYSDLIDKYKTPKYFIEPCEGTEDFVIIRFHAGPPYEDIAFKIVNKEWDIHRRSGFQNSFNRGVLQVSFNFKRSFYRR